MAFVVDLPKADRTFVEWARYHQVYHQTRRAYVGEREAEVMSRFRVLLRFGHFEAPRMARRRRPWENDVAYATFLLAWCSPRTDFDPVRYIHDTDYFHDTVERFYHPYPSPFFT